MHKLAALILQLENHIPEQEMLNPHISQASVGWHIEHTLLTIDVIIGALKRSKPQEYRSKFNFIRMLILAVGRIPRGRAQSPKVVQPAPDFNAESLQKHAGITTGKIVELESLQDRHFFEHPYLGNLNLKPAIRFLVIHTKHHIHIINDIIKK